MKKKLVITLASLVAVASGVAAIGTANYSVTSAEEAKVTTYLVLSSVGKYNDQPGENFAELYLENAIKFEGKPGDALPGKDEITAPGTSGEFDHWEAYEGTGFPTIYTTVPETSGKILYAFYKNTGENPGPGPLPDDEKTYYLNAGIWDIDGAWFAAWTWGSDSTGEWTKLDSIGGGYYSFTVDTSKVQNAIFVRMSSGATEMNWDNKWNQTSDLELSFDDCYTITGWGGAGQPSLGSWGTYSA